MAAAAGSVMSDRVRENTDPHVNFEIDEQVRERLHYYADAPAEEITTRIRELDREWDMERVLQTNAGAIALGGTVLAAMRGDRRFLVIPGVVFGFLLLHSMQGWCPPVPVFRRMGVRTRKEIDMELYALKALRGDFRLARGR